MPAKLLHSCRRSRRIYHAAHGAASPGTPPARKRRTRVGSVPNHGGSCKNYGIQATETDTRRWMLRNGDFCMELKTTRPGRTHATDRFARAARSPTVPQTESKAISPAVHERAALPSFAVRIFFNTHLLRTSQQPRRRRISPLTRRAATLPSPVALYPPSHKNGLLYPVLVPIPLKIILNSLASHRMLFVRSGYWKKKVSPGRPAANALRGQYEVDFVTVVIDPPK